MISASRRAASSASTEPMTRQETPRTVGYRLTAAPPPGWISKWRWGCRGRCRCRRRGRSPCRPRRARPPRCVGREVGAVVHVAVVAVDVPREAAEGVAPVPHGAAHRRDRRRAPRRHHVDALVPAPAERAAPHESTNATGPCTGHTNEPVTIGVVGAEREVAPAAPTRSAPGRRRQRRPRAARRCSSATRARSSSSSRASSDRNRAGGRAARRGPAACWASRLGRGRRGLPRRPRPAPGTASMVSAGPLGDELDEGLRLHLAVDVGAEHGLGAGVGGGADVAVGWRSGASGSAARRGRRWPRRAGAARRRPGPRGWRSRSRPRTARRRRRWPAHAPAPAPGPVLGPRVRSPRARRCAGHDRDEGTNAPA